MPGCSHAKLAAAVGSVALAAAVQRLLKWRAGNTSSALREGYPQPPGLADWLSAEEFACLVAVCDAFVPALRPEEVLADLPLLDLPAFLLQAGLASAHSSSSMDVLRAGALERQVHIRVCELLAHATSATEKADLKMLFGLLASTAGCLAVAGMAAPFTGLSLPNRVLAVQRLQHSVVPDLRVAYQSLKRLIASSFIDTLTKSEFEQSYGYNPEETVSKPARIADTLSHLPRPPPPAGPGQWDIEGYDVVVVGSGAGGGVMASELAKAGVRVLVLEKGGYYRADDFKRWRQGEAQKQLFEKSAFLQSKTGSVAILSGACVGGGTTLNWTASFRTPPHVLSDWAGTGLPAFRQGGAFSASLDAVHRLMSVNSKFSYRDDSVGGCGENPADCDTDFAVNGNNRGLWEGAKACGFTPERIPRNVKDCVDCGHCGE
jgi:hypothetical protein